MATLVLTTIGTLVGGPIGGAIGAFLGQQVDQRLLGTRSHGPRLGDLSVQTSAYGSAMPKLFGTLRVAGTVIWATDLIEDRHKSGGGKGKPKVTTYSYSASFAVALSGRPVRAIHRIWADGKLLRGAAGDWKSEVGAFRLHPGDEAQAVDPLIAAHEGAPTPAHRGIAYAVFEDLQLADFGNRIPSLTFEVEADAGPVTIGGIAEALAGDALHGDTEAALAGYAASGESVRAALETLASAARLALVDDGARLVLTDAMTAPLLLSADELGASADGKRATRRDATSGAAGSLPDEVDVAYYEPSRDYQAGLQRARRSGGPGRRVRALELAAAMEAGQAKAIAESALADAWAARATASVALPWRRLDLRPGGALRLDAAGPVYRIDEWTLEHMVLRLKLARLAAGTARVPDAVAGRGTSGLDAPHGPTTLALLDLPPLDDAPAATPRLWIAAAGGEAWRAAALSASLDGGASWQDLGATAAPATMGAALDVLTPGGAALIDAAGHVEVELLNEGMTLEGRDDDALVAGANMAMLGDELIQFGRAEQTGPGRYRLSRLLRGRRGSEWAASGHATGDRFVLIDSETLRPFDLPAGVLGANVRVLASGIGDAAAVEADAIAQGRALRPPPPVDPSARRLGDGTVRFAWVRRSRIGWGWLDGGDAPLGEESERYRLVITPSSGAARTIETAAPTCDYTPADQAADGASGATGFAVTLAQLGTAAPSLPPAWATFTL